ncbi:PQQ-like beta-propeller repeat protein [Lentzea sp. CC55]|uniref:PQQ-like beta-propeller repeat protein n=1 Tax=Lentzea sp. CC55 TaxID=2884909 RepID=UPI001F3E2213|nr:PQQ-like beta-propeller repeat protein [Lentzea sp. CC55]MCG8922232.1 PQQ-like beta-propeller repeat protein [Lentzea sp. CC55]
MKRWGMLAVAAAAITFGSTLAMPDVAVAAAEGGVICGTYEANSKITRSEVLARSRTWISARVPYSQADCFGTRYGAYRTDCSGFVSMAWGLRISYTTHILEQVAHRIDWEDLRPGDALNDRESHVALFIGWADAAKTRPIVREQAGPDGSRTVQRVWSASTARQYVPLRYNNIVEAGGAGSGSETPVTDKLVVSSGPQVSNTGQQQLEIFARDADGAVITNFHKTSRWNGWQQLGSEHFAGDPVALVNPQTKIVEVFARGTDDRIYRRVDGHWAALGDTVVAGDPALQWNDRTKAVEVLARGVDGSLLRFTDKWAQVGDRKIQGTPVVAENDVYARSSDDKLVKWDGTTWRDQGDKKIVSDPSVAVDQVFVRTESGSVEQYAAGVWTSLGGKGTGAPSAVYNSTTGSIDVVQLGEGGFVEHSRAADKGWTTWARLGTTKVAEAPSAMYHAQTKTVEVFARTEDGKLVRRFHKEKAGWSQWALLSDRGIS